MPYSHLTNAITSDSSLSQADIEAIQKPVAVRDGDDLIEIELPEEEEEIVDESRIEIKLSTDGSDEDEESENESESDDSEESGVDEDAGESDDSIPEFHKVDPKSLEEASEVLREASEGHKEIIAEAMEKGMTAEQMQGFQAEYDKDGKLSEKSYEALAELGYSKSFVNSFMAGQQSVADNFVRELVNYCGGEANFDKLTAFIGANQPETAAAFNAAVERNDVTTIKALLENSKAAMRQSFGSKPKRNLAAAAKPRNTAPAPKQAEGFSSRAEMVKAMSDVRYERDAAYRREVELRVFASNW